MKIAVDFRDAANPTRAGKGEYVWQLISEWVRFGGEDTLVLLIQPNQQVNLPAGNWVAKTIPARGLLWHLWVIGWLELTRPVAVYFSTTSLIVPAFVRRVKTVTTIADFTTWRFPKTHLGRAVVIEKLTMARALVRSTKLIAISEFTRQEAVSLFRIAPTKINVIPLAVGSQFHPINPTPEEVSAVRQRYGLPEKFLLFLGTLEPRKNIARTIEAFGSVATSFPEYKLVLAGAKGWQVNELFAQSDPNLVLTGYIADADRPILYHLSDGLIFPSLYEGFGLPPLEAMSMGTPVITSQTASLPEVVGDAAILVDPTNTQAIAHAINQLLSNSSLRVSLSQRGLVQAQKFSWSATLLNTLKVIHSE